MTRAEMSEICCGCRSDAGGWEEAFELLEGPDLRSAATAERRMKVQLANALTAILCHAEAIRRCSAGDSPAAIEIETSAGHICSATQRLWVLLETAEGFGACEKADR